MSLFPMRTALFTASLLLIAFSVFSAPVPDDEKTFIDFRRTTLVVKDIARSLTFYRDALGMNVIYDNEINTPRSASVEEAEKASRLVLLQANDDYIGIVGLLQYIKPKKPSVDLTDTSFNEGTTVMVFNTQELESSFVKATQVKGVKVLGAPSLAHYPSYDGKSTISVLVSVLQDPDGFTVELNQLQ